MIVDAHLDLSYNALHGRDVRRPAAEQPPDPEGDIATVGLPDLLDGGVRLMCATLFCQPGIDGKPGYRTAQEAHDEALKHLDWYEKDWRDQPFVRVTERDALAGPPDGPPGYILLMEGADPIRTPDDLRVFFDRGVRMVGMAWKRTRYAGGTGAPGPLTPDGVALVRDMDALGIIHDASHLADESFWQLMDLAAGPVCASHSNCRRIVPTDRQLSDDMVRAIVSRGGVIGINFYDKFLVPPDEYGKRRATLADVVRHVQHVCDLAGGTTCVGLGTDMDGGVGREQVPEEITTSADLPRVGDALSAVGFEDVEVDRILGANWLHFFRRCLPQSR
jgi:membrane dipeptidase